MFNTDYSTKSAIALIALSVPIILSIITSNVSIVDAFHPQPLLCRKSIPGQAAIVSNLIRPRDAANARSILAFRASDKSRLVPSEEMTDFTAREDEAEDEDEHDELVSSLTEKLEQAEGMWYSDDFYGPHGREWVKVSATLTSTIATTGTCSSALVAVKITGDPNIPSGCTTWKTLGWPELGGGVVPAEIQVRANPNDPNGFSWVAGKLGLVSEDQIVLSARFSPFFETRGTFHKQSDDEDGGK